MGVKASGADDRDGKTDARRPFKVKDCKLMIQAAANKEKSSRSFSEAGGLNCK